MRPFVSAWIVLSNYWRKWQSVAQSYRSRFLSAQRQSEQALKSLFASLAHSIAAEVTRRAAPDGTVPRSATFEIQQAAGELVRRLFLGRTGRGELAPFDILPDGAVLPLSPYTRQLWESIRTVVRIPIEQTASILVNRLPVDILVALRSATLNPFVVAVAAVAEQVFRPNPLAAYDAPHTWVDPNGYRLSDRVWNAATDTRQQIDVYLETAIREGRGSLTMSRELAHFLTPGEELRRTTKPYGTTASFSGMRLARTEISQAHQRAFLVSAAMNPFVAGAQWNLSASHPRIDICDDLARGGPAGDGVYSLEAYPGRPHPQCLCFPTNVLVEKPGDILDELRADIQSARAEFVNLVGPLQVDAFERLLMGQGLETLRAAGPIGRVGLPTIVRTPPPPVVRTPPPPVVEPLPVIAPPPIVEPPLIVEPPVVTPPQTFQHQPAERQIIDVERRIDTALERAAQRNNVPLEEFEQGVSDGFRKLVDGKDLAIQFKSENIDQFLADPRFKTQFETRTTGGVLDLEGRANAEFAGLGAPLDLDPRERPIYGYVNLGPRAQNRVSQYGDVTFVLKDNVRERTTVTMDDSLYNFGRSQVAGTPINAPQKASWDGQFTSLYKYNQTGDLNEIFEEVSYVEIQIQRGVGIGDVRGIIDRKRRLTASQRQQLNDRGVEVWDN